MSTITICSDFGAEEEIICPHLKPAFSHSSVTRIKKFLSSFLLSAISGGSVQFTRSVVSNSLQPHGLQHARLPCPSPTPGAYSNSCPSSRWCHPTISSSVIPVSSCLQFFLPSRSFPVSQFFASGNQNIGVSTSSSVLPMNIQGWFSLILIGLILQSKVLSRVFFSTTVRRHVFFTTQPFLWFYGSHIHTWLLEKP